MRGYYKYLIFILVLIAVLFNFSRNEAFSSESKCINCHKVITPGIVEQFLSGKMGQVSFDCTICHGNKHTNNTDFQKAEMPTIETCKRCHPSQVEQYRAGKHNLAWLAVTAMPNWTHQPVPTRTEYKGCSGCHKHGEKSLEERKKYRYGNAQCDACHTRHSFNKSEASDPRACQTCHMGFDHPQWEMWSTSKHGTIWQIEGKDSKRAPTCQTCHMSNGNHTVITSWGFLALRVPEDDKDWWKDRVTILQALGVLDEKGNPTSRFEVVKIGKVARLSKEEWLKEREKMIKICSNCHAESYARKQLEAADFTLREIDRIFAEAIRIVKSLYDEGILKKPKDWNFAPDLLMFYEAKTPIELELYKMFMEYRMKAFQAAFHNNPDYMHWYGWAPLKESLAKIKYEAEKLKKEKARGNNSFKF